MAGIYAGAALDEQDLENNLGVQLDDAADFCLVFKTTGFVGPDQGAAEPEFEVWAALRAAAGNVAMNPAGGGTCIPSDNKRAPTQWVSATAGEMCSSGRVVVLHYPPPPDAVSGAFDWASGISISNVFP